MANTISIEVLEAQRDRFRETAKKYLDEATQWLHNNADNWSESHEAEWQAKLKKAEAYAIRMTVLDDIIRDGKVIGY